jgi:hypothetical protein
VNADAIPLPAQTWTAADGAEFDALVHALAFDYFEHRQACEACRPGPCPRYEAWLEHKARCRICGGVAPLTHGWDCPWRRRFLEEHRNCVRCLPCPHLQAAIREVVDWFEARRLLTRAEELRREQDVVAP